MHEPDADDPPESTQWTLEPSLPPLRLDVALTRALAAADRGVTRSMLARAFAAGGVRVDGRVCKPSRLVESRLQVSLTLPAPAPLSASPEPIPLSILHEDDDLLVIDKPAGMVVHPGPGHTHGTLVAAVLHHLGVRAQDLPVLPGNDATRPGIVHRIDRDTSGAVVVAKHARAQEILAAQFRAHSIERRYWALVCGDPPWPSRTVHTGHARDPADRRRFHPAPFGRGVREAITTLSVRERLGAAAVIEAMLQTGRTHQIRMHARHVGHPILGDAVYGGAARREPLASVSRALGRHALHAATLGFAHPDGGRAVRFEAALPPELVEAVAALQAAGAGRRDG